MELLDIYVPEGYTETEEGDIMPPLQLIDEDFGQYTEYRTYTTPIEGVVVWERKAYPDARGTYQEKWKKSAFKKVNAWPGKKNPEDEEPGIVQSGVSSNRKGAFRGIHAERMIKFATPILGRFFIAVVDLRRDSETFGRYITFTIDQTDIFKARKTVVIAENCGHAFEALTDGIYDYSQTEEYVTSEGKRSLIYSDRSIRDVVNGHEGIIWPDETMIISEQDLDNPSFEDLKITGKI